MTRRSTAFDQHIQAAGVARHLLGGGLDRCVVADIAAWTLLDANLAWSAVQGEVPGESVGRNILLSYFSSHLCRVHADDEQTRAWELALISDLRAAAVRYPTDPAVVALLADLRATGQRFNELWESQLTAGHNAHHKVFMHPDLGPLELDCDVLEASDADLRLVIFTAAPGSVDARLLASLGPDELVSQSAPDSIAR